MQQTPEEIARAWFEQVWNRGSEQAIDALMAPAAKFHGLSPVGDEPVVGPAAFKPFVKQFRNAFPDIRVEINQLISEGDKVAVHCTVTGTHRGETLGVPATNTHVEIAGMGLARIENGRIAEAWNTFDFAALYKQLGLQHP